MGWAFEVADGSLVPARQLADSFAEQTGPDGSFSDEVREAGP